MCLISKDMGHISIYVYWIWCVQNSKRNYEQFPVFQTSPPLWCIFDWSVSIFDECLLFEKKIYLWCLLDEKNILFFVAAPSFIFDANVFLLPILLKHLPPSNSSWWWWWLTYIYDKNIFRQNMWLKYDTNFVQHFCKYFWTSLWWWQSERNARNSDLLLSQLPGMQI